MHVTGTVNVTVVAESGPDILLLVLSHAEAEALLQVCGRAPENPASWTGGDETLVKLYGRLKEGLAELAAV